LLLRGGIELHHRNRVGHADADADTDADVLLRGRDWLQHQR
jgi:hypothetical protein